MKAMFKRCSALTNINLSSFNTSKVNNMKEMFYECNELTTIYVSNNFVTTNVNDSTNMFYNCNKLKGGNGTTYNSSYIDKTYARIDTLETPGYFTFSTCVRAKLYTDGTLILSNTDYTDTSRTLSKDYGNNYNGEPVWVLDRSSIKNVIIQERIRPKNTRAWFGYCENLEEITGISNLDTSQVTNMEYMFCYCKKLENLDLSSFNTSNVTNMRYMFDNCENLENLNLSSFNTVNVINMEAMIENCKKLTALELNNFDTSNVIYMGAMFFGCDKLKTLDLTNFNTSNVTDMEYMFSNCGNLETIYVGPNFITTNVTLSDFMFDSCTSIKGGNGTTYNSSFIDKTYARIDKAGTPGYFSKKTAN